MVDVKKEILLILEEHVARTVTKVNTLPLPLMDQIYVLNALPVPLDALSILARIELLLFSAEMVIT